MGYYYVGKCSHSLRDLNKKRTGYLPCVPNSIASLLAIKIIMGITSDCCNMLPHPPPTGLHRGLIRGIDFPPSRGEFDCQIPRGSIEIYTGQWPVLPP